MHLMALPAADFSKFCWNRIRLILAGTVRQGDGSFLPSFCHPAKAVTGLTAASVQTRSIMLLMCLKNFLSITIFLSLYLLKHSITQAFPFSNLHISDEILSFFPFATYLCAFFITFLCIFYHSL